ncbi:helix-turn-helix domain-containing protein [Herbiconiux moechotypicola]|uniref:HTH cro/C1-type domain-containing protein n=1 Tax=Herbiconiux moechotypicola TaxID=637393 RepID=A0ABP5QHG8_9MICO|nr:helix-turn-helix transcriptional regulator [Herbiconiux moechotypicola]MCS5730218.1 helix-turn-helix domain-containing protein [Herbiconiux moechotypicola]
MTDTSPMSSLGERIRALRRERGFRTQRDLAEAIPGGNVSLATIENIESGRKTNVDVSQLLNIARALRVPPIYLLAPIRTPSAEIDLPNLSESFEGMTAVEFDAWLSGIEAGAYHSLSIEERNATAELQALRTLHALRSEITRYEAMLELQGDDDERFARSTHARLEEARREAKRIETLLGSAQWTLGT